MKWTTTSNDAPAQQLGETAEQVARAASEAARGVQVADIGYGRIHWGNYRDQQATPGPYYGFLAGLVASQDIRTICEIGTHTGGATRAMHRGLRDPAASHIVTIDVTRESNKSLSGVANVTKVSGDAVAESTVRRALACLSATHKADLLFIDGGHDYLSELLIFSIYAQALSPRLVAIDDIKINSEMRRLWARITATRSAALAIDVATVLPEVRARDVGFGLILMPENASVPTLDQPVQQVRVWKKRLRNVAKYLASDKLGRI